MDASRRTSLAAGGLFIVATAASLMGTAVEAPITSGAGGLTQIAGNVSRVSLGGLFELIAAATSAGIAIALYPVLRRWSAGVALGSVVFRAIEAVMYALGAVCLLALPAVSQPLAGSSADRAASHAAGGAFLALRQEAILAGVFAFAVGALLYYAVLFRSRLVPRWLSGWGLVAAVVMLGACLSALFTASPVTTYTILVLPIAVQEMALAAWLIARGFEPSVVGSGLEVRVDLGNPEPGPSTSAPAALRP